jgi:hypothetical protein
MEAIAKKYAELGALRRPEPPFEAEALRAWAVEAARFRNVEIPADVAFLESIKGMGGIDGQRQSSLVHWVGSATSRRIAENVGYVTDITNGQVVSALEFAKFIRSTDPDDQDQITNRVLGEGALERAAAQFAAGFEAIGLAAILDEALKPGDAPDRTSQRGTLEAAQAHLQQLAAKGLEQVRLPRAATEDPELLRIAKEVLADPKSGAHAVRRIVVNANKVRREKKEGTITPGTVSATVEVFHYVWDEFQVATAEQVGQEFWIHYTTLKFFHSGGSRTPLQRWVISGRFKSTPILEANIGK